MASQQIPGSCVRHYPLFLHLFKMFISLNSIKTYLFYACIQLEDLDKSFII